MAKYVGPKTDPANVATQADITGGGAPLSNAAPDAITPDQAGAAGTSSDAARADHSHEINAAAPGTITPDASAAEGSSNSFARADHTHAIAAASAGTITGVSSSEGSSTSFSRADHTHAISLPRCAARRSANQSINNGSAILITFPDEDIDTDGFHSTSTNTGRITIPSGLGGDYLVTGFVTFASNDNGSRAAILHKNGGGLNDRGAGKATTGGISHAEAFSTMLSLVATDYLEIYVYQDSGGALNVVGAGLTVVRVG